MTKDRKLLFQRLHLRYRLGDQVLMLDRYEGQVLPS
jgi:hypothetical protein